MDHGLSTVIELGLAEVPLLLVPDHGIQLVYGGDEGELGVLEHLGVSLGQLLVFCLLANAGSAHKTIVLASLAGELAVTLRNSSQRKLLWKAAKGAMETCLGLLHPTSLTCFPNPLMSAVRHAMSDMIVVCRSAMRAGTFRGVSLGFEDLG